MNILYNKKVKYIILILVTIFLLFSIYYFKEHVLDIGIEYSELSSDEMTGEQKFLLHVNEPTTIYLLHDAEIGSGEIKFELVKENGEIIDEYKLISDKVIKESYKLEKGNYYCSLVRNINNNEETFMLYYDKRYVVQEYLKNDSITKTDY